MKVNPNHYDFDEVEEIKVPSHYVYKLIFKKNGKILKETYQEASRWEKYKKYPSIVFNEIK